MHKFLLLVAANNDVRAQRARTQRREDMKARFRDRLKQDFARTMSDVEFVQHFRLNKDGFHLLCDDLRNLGNLKGTRLYPVEKKVLIALSFMATGSYQKIVGLSHKTPQRTVSRFVKEVVGALNCPRIIIKWIKFPYNLQDRVKSKAKFYRKFHLPGVIGCIDCSHVNIVTPKNSEHLYFNRKGTHSINVQMICDSDMTIINVNAKFGGSTHDSMVWMHSNLNPYMRELHRNGELSCFLGDSGYPRRAWLLTPVLNAQPGSRELVYTRRHVKARNVIERCFGVLKGRWRCLHQDRALHYTPAVASKIVMGCSVLHNISQHLRLPLPPIDLDNLEEESNVAAESIPESFGNSERAERAHGLAALENILRVCL